MLAVCEVCGIKVGLRRYLIGLLRDQDLVYIERGPDGALAEFGARWVCECCEDDWVYHGHERQRRKRADGTEEPVQRHVSPVTDEEPAEERPRRPEPRFPTIDRESLLFLIDNYEPSGEPGALPIEEYVARRMPHAFPALASRAEWDRPRATQGQGTRVFRPRGTR